MQNNRIGRICLVIERYYEQNITWIENLFGVCPKPGLLDRAMSDLVEIFQRNKLEDNENWDNCKGVWYNL